jgi:rod shape determining protein RodA
MGLDPGLNLEASVFSLQSLQRLLRPLAVARIMSIHDFKINRINNLIKVAFVTLLPAGMIILQNDTGSALVYAAFVIVMYREGLSPWFLILGLMFVALFISALLTNLFYVFLSLPIITILVFHVIYRNARMTFVGVLCFFNNSCSPCF